MTTDTVILWPATMADAALLHDWRNHPSARAASHSTAEIAYEAHVAWLQHSLADPNRRILIAELNGEPAGTVRADLSQGVWDLSWAVSPEHRGYGIGARMVQLLAETIDDPLRAEVKTGNVASARIAEAAGLSLAREAGGVLHFERRAQVK